MTFRRLIPCAVLLVALPCRTARAQDETASTSEVEHTIVYEVGWAADWSNEEGTHAAGGTFAFEVTPIENVLELEVGATAIRAKGSTEMSFDVLFKKPWTLSRKAEFMAGVGPELIHDTGPGGSTRLGLSAVLDFMFWPTRNVGWYLEPGYEATVRNGLHHGLGMAAGLIIGR